MVFDENLDEWFFAKNNSNSQKTIDIQNAILIFNCDIDYNMAIKKVFLCKIKESLSRFDSEF